MTTCSSRVEIGQGRKQLITDEPVIQSSRANDALQRAVSHATEYLNGLD